MKKLPFIILSFLFCISLLCGCSSKHQNSTFNSDNTNTTVENKSSVSTTESPDITNSDINVEISDVNRDFASFFNNEASATFSNSINSCGNISFDNLPSEVQFDELTQFVANSYDNSQEKLTISKAILNKEDKDILLLKYEGLNLYCEDDSSFIVFAIVPKNGKYTITYAAESWPRNEVYFYNDSSVASFGSGGAGDSISTKGYLDSNGVYNDFFYCETCYAGWISSLFSCFDNHPFSEDSIAAATELDNQMLAVEDVSSTIALYVIDNTYYGHFDFAGDYPASIVLREAAQKNNILVLDSAELYSIISSKYTNAGFSIETEGTDIVWTPVE